MTSKNFNKFTYKDMVKTHLKEAMPSVEEEILENSSHFISNALNNEAQRKLHSKKSHGNSSTTNTKKSNPPAGPDIAQSSCTVADTCTSLTNSQIEACFDTTITHLMPSITHRIRSLWMTSSVIHVPTSTTSINRTQNRCSIDYTAP